VHRVLVLAVPALSALLVSSLFARGDGTFWGPARIESPETYYVPSLAAGDFNGDGAVDLAVVAAAGTVSIFLQNGIRFREWSPQMSVNVGVKLGVVRAADLDADGDDDLLVADLASTAYTLTSKGDGTFEDPVALVEGRSSRGLAVGDWNQDSHLDVASAEHEQQAVAVFLGDGRGKLRFGGRYPTATGVMQCIEALHFDDDGVWDLAVGIEGPGLVTLRGLGDGTFRVQRITSGFGCVRELIPAYMDGDARHDVAASCRSSGPAFAGLSNGDGSFRKTFNLVDEAFSKEVAIADFNRDGAVDLAIGGSTFWIGDPHKTVELYLGSNDGRFTGRFSVPLPAEAYRIIAHDLDRDGFADLAGVAWGSSRLIVAWGKPEIPYLETIGPLTGFGSVKALALGDLNGDGLDDVFLPSAELQQVHVYLADRKGLPPQPSLTIPVAGLYHSIEAVDLDGDGVLDLVGSGFTTHSVHIAYLERTGKVREEIALAAGAFPGTVTVGDVDGDAVADLVLPSTGSHRIDFFMGKDGKGFADLLPIPTIRNPRKVILGDLDLDDRVDLLVISAREPAVQYGGGAVSFSEPVIVEPGPSKVYTDGAIADIDGDSIPDILVTGRESTGVRIFRGKGGRRFEAIEVLPTDRAPLTLALADLDGNGFPEVTAACGAAQSISLALNFGLQGFVRRPEEFVGLQLLGHRLGDLDGDGVFDIVAFSSTEAVVLYGREAPLARLRRGDSDGDGRFEINDPVDVLNRLFLGGGPFPCQDAADGNDDGVINLSDAVVMLQRLFLGGEPLPLPGSEACGEDPTDDRLVWCTPGC